LPRRFDLVVVGGGFAGVYAAWRMARAGLRVALVEGSAHLGGSLDAFAWKGYRVDHGCHFLDLRDPDSAEFFADLLGPDLLELDAPRWGVASGGGWIEGYEFPDFTDDPAFCREALAEMAGLRAAPGEAAGNGWLDWYRASRGGRLADAIAPMAAKVTGNDPARIGLDARRSLQMFERVRLGSDAEMTALKGADPFWDDRLAVTLASGDPRFLGLNAAPRFGYPRSHGLHGFGLAAARRLAELGVELRLGRAVAAVEAGPGGLRVLMADDTLSAGQIFWSLPEHTLADILGIDHALKTTALPVGSAFWAFEVEAAAVFGPDYLHDYSTRLPFRLNRAGIYGRQVTPDGRTYVMAEIPGHPARLAAHRTPEARDASWRAMVETGYVARDAAWSDAVSWSLPVALTLQTAGGRAEQARVEARIAAMSDRIHGVAFGYRGRGAFIRFCRSILEPAILSGRRAAA
jgi:glycine/D-amino acid oxidase-like deaminating enzyme